MNYEIVQVTPDDEVLIRQVAEVLSESFHWDADWGTREGSLEEVNEILDNGVAFAAVDDGQVLGWIGALNAYRGKTWELHPMVVRPNARMRGVGRALAAHLENALSEMGVSSIMLGTDDEDGRTNLSQVDDLYALLPGILANITSLNPANPHPVDFYRKCGYAVVGVVPDANGSRKPDIYMAKRLF